MKKMTLLMTALFALSLAPAAFADDTTTSTSYGADHGAGNTDQTTVETKTKDNGKKTITRKHKRDVKMKDAAGHERRHEVDSETKSVTQPTD